VPAQASTSFTSALVDTIVPVTQTATITITYDAEKYGDQSPLESLIRAILMAKYPTLGIAGASLSISEPQRQLTNPNQPPKEWKPFTRLVLTVNRRMRHSQLI
jgi:hypothetical protein